MVAMEHSSGEVRARAVEQLARALSSADAAVNGDEGAPGAFFIFSQICGLRESRVCQW